MKTKTAKVSVPATDREPTDAELHEIEENGDLAPTNLGSPVENHPLVASTQIDLARLGLNQIAYVRRHA